MPDFSQPILPDMSPTNENAARLAQAPKPLPHEVMLKRAEYLSQKGLPELADKYYQNADKLRPEVKEVRQVMQNGTPADLVVYKDGTHKVLPYGSAVKQELADFGGSKGVWNPITGQIGAQYGKSVSPDAALSADIQTRGQNITLRGQDLTDARAREQLAAAAEGKNKPTEGQLVSAGYGHRMANAEKILGGIGTEGLPTYATFGASLVGGRYGGQQGADAASGVFMNEKQQQYRQAQEDWVRAKLRKESGAVIGPEEMEREIRVYFPMPWDDEKVRRQKKIARKRALEAMEMAAGPAKSMIQVVPQQDPLGIR